MLKTCTKCLRAKELYDFHTEKRAKDGLTSACRDCRNAQKRVRKAPQKPQARVIPKKEEKPVAVPKKVIPYKILIEQAGALSELSKQAMKNTEDTTPSVEMQKPQKSALGGLPTAISIDNTTPYDDDLPAGVRKNYKREYKIGFYEGMRHMNTLCEQMYKENAALQQEKALAAGALSELSKKLQCHYSLSVPFGKKARLQIHRHDSTVTHYADTPEQLLAKVE